MPKNTLFL